MVRGAMFTLSFKLWKGRKLRRNIQIPGELVTFNFHVSKVGKVFIFMILGTRGHVNDPPNPLFLTLDTPNYSTYSKKHIIVFGK